MYEYDKRVVLTLDAGGTNFVFSAIQGNNEMISPIGLPASLPAQLPRGILSFVCQNRPRPLHPASYSCPESN